MRDYEISFSVMAHHVPCSNAHPCITSLCRAEQSVFHIGSVRPDADEPRTSQQLSDDGDKSSHCGPGSAKTEKRGVPDTHLTASDVS